MVWLGKPLTQNTWEPATSIPSKLIEDYEKGINHVIYSKLSSSSGGHNVYALFPDSTLQTDALPPESKRTCTIVESSNSGYVNIMVSSTIVLKM